MAIKKLFNAGATKIEAGKERYTIDSELETTGYGEVKVVDRERYFPRIDFSNPKNWARYGSAERYYQDSFARIYDSYPFDGSKTEKLEWHNSSSFVDEYIFDYVYPRTTGSITFFSTGNGNSKGTYTLGSSSIDTVDPAEYILIKGGPNAGPAGNRVDANVYDESKNRTSNLKFGGSDGNTIEFWLKKSHFPFNSEVVFSIKEEWGDLKEYEQQNFSIVASSASADSGSFSIAGIIATGVSYEAIPFVVEFASPTVSESFDGNWHHYAFSIEDTTDITASSGSVFSLRFDNVLVASSSLALAYREMESPIYATLGGFVGSGSLSAGDGKLSGSLDEFRFWKKLRTEKQIGRNWFTTVDGGNNKDDLNVDLGVYYKFNEGATATSSVDSIVLDYSGRLSHGVMQNYVSGSRVTSSAITGEFLEPIMRTSNPEVVAKLAEMITSGSIHDTENNTCLYHSMPSWLTEADDNDGTLWRLTQIIGSYFDSLYIQIEELSSLKNIKYTPATSKPLPFADRLLSSNGLIVPEVFVEASLLESLVSRDEDRIFEDKIENLKNRVYENIYNNLSWIIKSKGTEKSLRNLIRCYGIDDEMIKINLYSDKAEFTFEDKSVKSLAKGKKYVDFNHSDRFDSVVYQAISSSIPNSLGYIPGSANFNYVPMTVEAEAIFPRKFSKNSEFYTGSFIESSIFGMNGPTGSETDFGFHVTAVKTYADSPDVYFRISSSQFDVDTTSSVFYDVYEDEKWNFAVKLYPLEEKIADVDNNSTYILSFYGVNYVAGEKENSFCVTSSLSYVIGSAALAANKRLYIGSNRVNFTGAVVNECDAKISSVRYWISDLDYDVIDAHAKDAGNFGTLYPTREVTKNLHVPEAEALVLHWTFYDNASADTGGGVPSVSDAGFWVKDVSSGSLRSYGTIDTVLQKVYMGRGNLFLPSTRVIDKSYVVSAQQQLPEILNSSDTISISTQADEELFTKDIRPVNYFWSIEKSMYQSISEEMVNWFGTIVGFNNLIGEPVNRFRIEYKDLGKLRQLFFEKVSNTPDVEKYINYYKWIDSSINIFLRQLVPASANFSENIRNMIESHILERNKYWTKYPTLEMKQPDPYSGLRGIKESKYNWNDGHASANQTTSSLWWSDRAERTNSQLTSGNSSIDSNKEIINRIAKGYVSGSTYFERKFTRAYEESVEKLTNVEDTVTLPVAQIKNVKVSGSVHTMYNSTDSSPTTFDSIIPKLQNNIGNYQKEYEIVQVHGNTANNGWFVDMRGIVPRFTFVAPFSGSYNGFVESDFLVAQRERKAHVFIERFSSPGEKKTMSEGRLDPIGGEKSPYNSLNFRNLDVRKEANTGSSTVFTGQALSHKVNKNVDYKLNSAGTAAVETYDNGFIQHPIPRNVFGYSWIAASYVTFVPGDMLIGFAELDSTGSSRLFFVSSSFYRNLSGSNTTITTNNNLVSFGSTWESTMYPPFQWASWEQTRVAEHPVARILRQENIVSIQDPPKERESFDSSGKLRVYRDRRSDSFTNFYEPPISWNKSMKAKVKDPDNNIVDLEFSHANNIERFANAELMDRLGLGEKESLAYGTVRGMYQGENAKFTFLNFASREIIYPKKSNVGFGWARSRSGWDDLSNTVKRAEKRNVFWKDSSEQRKILNMTSSLNSVISTGSIWPMDDGVSSAGRGEASYLSDEEKHKFFVDNGLVPTNMPSASVQFNYKPYSSGSLEYKYGYGSGSFLSSPTYDTYEDYSNELRLLGQSFTILPEFRISEHMDFYINEKGGDFRAENKGFLTLRGATVDSSSMVNRTTSNEEFYKIYSHSDFMKYFDMVVEDHKEEGSEKTVSLSCKAIKKLLPYNGFYPLQRNIQLASLMSESFAGYLSADTSVSKQTQLQALMQPFFAPGIFFNTVKSGIAVDWQLQTGSLNPSENYFDMQEHGHIKTNSSARLPFESVFSLKSYFPYLRYDEERNSEAKNIYLVDSFYGRYFPTYNVLSQSTADGYFSNAVDIVPSGTSQLAALSVYNYNGALDDQGIVYLYNIENFLTGSTDFATAVTLPDGIVAASDTYMARYNIKLNCSDATYSFLFAQASKTDTYAKSCVVVFTGSNWGYSQTIQSPSGANYFGQFGMVSDGNHLAVSDYANSRGETYFFTSSGGFWGTSSEDDNLKFHVMYTPDMSGSYYVGNYATLAASASVYKHDGVSWKFFQYLAEIPISYGISSLKFNRATKELFALVHKKRTGAGFWTQDYIPYVFNYSLNSTEDSFVMKEKFELPVYGFVDPVVPSLYNQLCVSGNFLAIFNTDRANYYTHFYKRTSTGSIWEKSNVFPVDAGDEAGWTQGYTSLNSFFSYNNNSYFARLKGYYTASSVSQGQSYIHKLEDIYKNIPKVKWNGKGKSNFELASHNYFAEIPSFFLKDNKLTSYFSKKEIDFGTMQSGTYYFMDVTLNKTDKFEMIKTADTYKKGRFFGPPALFTKINYSAGSSREDGYQSFVENVVDPAFSIFAPPYFGGKSIARVYFLPTETKKYSLSEIFAGLQAQYMNEEAFLDTKKKFVYREDVPVYSGSIFNKAFDSYGPYYEYINNEIMKNSASIGTASFFFLDGSSVNLNIHTKLSSSHNAVYANFDYSGSSEDVLVRKIYGGSLPVAVETGSILVSSSAGYIASSSFDDFVSQLGLEIKNYELSSSAATTGIGNPLYKKFIKEGLDIAYLYLYTVSSDITTCNEYPYYPFYFEFTTNATRSRKENTVFYDYPRNIDEGLFQQNRPNEWPKFYYTSSLFIKDSPAFLGKMNVASSVNLTGKARDKIVEQSVNDLGVSSVSSIDDNSTAVDRWVISTKMECPALNFNHYDVTNGANDIGIWGGYGEIPVDEEGIFLSVEDSVRGLGNVEATVPKYTIFDKSYDSEIIKVKSLIDICGFERVAKKIGQLASSKVIKEAIVAIPFLDDSRNIAPKTVEIDGRNFFSIERNLLEVQRSTSKKTTITNMYEKMKNYVIPPRFDFATYSDIKPFVMYIFEFEHTLDKEDLSLIWQNLMPKIARKAEKAESRISHAINENEFFGGEDIPKYTRWLVFKVKQKAAISYYKATEDVSDDDRFTFKFKVGQKAPEFSYNWPYDYFSLVEMAQIEADLYLNPKAAFELNLPGFVAQEPVYGKEDSNERSLGDPKEKRIQPVQVSEVLANNQPRQDNSVLKNVQEEISESKIFGRPRIGVKK